MAFPLKDVRYTVRRQAAGLPALYPRLLRDKAVLPKIDMAVRYFESLVGRERADLDVETLVHFFGDPKLARCVVAALSRTYRYRARHFDEVLRPPAAALLAAAGISAPKLLRLALYDHLNEAGDGFVDEVSRETAYGALAAKLLVRTADVEQGLFLDADERAVLTRIGRQARSADVVAQYNFGSLEAILRHAERVELGVRKGSAGLERTAHSYAGAYDLTASIDDGGVLAVVGRQDALGNWSRHGRKVASLLVELLGQGRDAFAEGAATIALPGRRAVLRLNDEALDVLAGGAGALPAWGDDRTARQDVLAQLIALVRSSAEGCTVRRLPDPQAWAAGVLLPDLEVRVARHRVLLRAVTSVDEARRLGPLGAALAGEAVRFVGYGPALAPLRSVGASVVSLEGFQVGQLIAA